MELILTIAVWAGLFFLMMRLGCGTHTNAGSRKNGLSSPSQTNAHALELTSIAREKSIDPVCQKTISTHIAKTNVHAGKVIYFCSRDCREIFEAAPELYITSADTTKNQTEHAHV